MWEIDPVAACAECGFRYEETSPERIGAAIVDGAEEVVALLAGGDLRRRRREDLWSPLAEEWKKTLLYTYPEPAERPLSWVAAHALHEVRHHRLDIARQV